MMYVIITIIIIIIITITIIIITITTTTIIIIIIIARTKEDTVHCVGPKGGGKSLNDIIAAHAFMPDINLKNNKPHGKDLT